LFCLYSSGETSPLIADNTKDVEEAKKSSTFHDSTSQQKEELLTKKKSFSQSIHEILVHRPKPNPCLLWFYFIEIVAVLASLCLFTTQLIPIIIAYPQVGFLWFALRVYVACLCIVFILVELQVPLPFLQNNTAFQEYISRGFLYSFVGLVGMEQAYSARIEDVVKHASTKLHIGWTPLFMQISSWTMVVVGYIYVVMGVFCMKQLRNNLQENYQQRMDEYNRAKPIEKSNVP